MESFESVGAPWDKVEEEQLTKEYTIDKLNVSDLCAIHKRNAGGIISRLKRLNLIDAKKDVRGYYEYVHSDFYKDAKKQRREKRRGDKEIYEDKLPVQNYLSEDVRVIKQELEEINNKLDRIFKFMEAHFSNTKPHIIPPQNDPPKDGKYSVIKGSGLLEDECYLLQFDGLSNPNPGESTAGAVLFSPIERRPVFERGSYMGHATNNQAEYTGLLIGIKGAIKFGVKSLLIEGDSQLVIFQTEGKWKLANDALKSIHSEIQILLEQFDFVGIRHIPRDKNAYADKITNDVIRSKKSFFIKKSLA